MPEGYLCNACYWYSKRHDGQSRPQYLIVQHGSKPLNPKTLRRPVVRHYDVGEALLKLKHAFGSASQMASPPNPISINIESNSTIRDKKPATTVASHNSEPNDYDCIEVIPDAILDRALKQMKAEWEETTRDLNDYEIMASFIILGYSKY
jgi:hypothetical protein